MSQSQQTMNAAAIDEFGAQVTPHKLPLPEIGPDEILIRVESAGVGQWDPYELQGEFARMMNKPARFPYVAGSDGAGRVVEVGDRVSGFKKGDPVYAFGFMNPKGGFYAEYVAVKATNVSRIPGKLTVEEAGVLAVDGITALRGLDDVLGLKAGETILILGASGGIGHLAVQLAKRMGARVLAVASGGDGVSLAKQIGADVAVDGRKDDPVAVAIAFAPTGLDTALLTAGGPAADKAISALRVGGRVAYPNGVEPAPKPHPDVTINAYDGTPTPELIRELNALIDREPFHVHVDRTFPLNQAAEALRALNKHYLGKLALRPS